MYILNWNTTDKTLITILITECIELKQVDVKS